MAYELHIKRTPAITIEEWLNAVKEIDGVKIDESDSVGINPKTKEVIKISGSAETASLWFPNLEQWIKVFRFRRGKTSFKAIDWDDLSLPLRSKAFELARKLNAEILGDNGEKY